MLQHKNTGIKRYCTEYPRLSGNKAGTNLFSPLLGFFLSHSNLVVLVLWSPDCLTARGYSNACLPLYCTLDLAYFLVYLSLCFWPPFILSASGLLYNSSRSVLLFLAARPLSTSSLSFIHFLATWPLFYTKPISPLSLSWPSASSMSTHDLFVLSPLSFSWPIDLLSSLYPLTFICNSPSNLPHADR